jgi:hypothetical protein
MTFSDFIAALSKELGVSIETEGDSCAVRAGASDDSSVTVLLQGYDERGAVLATADLGAPPPERLEKLFRALLEANDLFRDTGGATLSLDPDTGKVRLQRFDALDALSEAGPAKALLAFLDIAAAWAKIIGDYRDAPEDKAAGAADSIPSTPASGIFA